MIHTTVQQHRVLAIAPSTRGFGFAVLEGPFTLVNWGVKSVEGDKNAETLTKVGEMIAHYQPDIVVVEDCEAKGGRRSVRIRTLCGEIAGLVRSRGVKLVLFSREQVMRTFFEDGEGTKYGIAAILSKRFADELDCRLPPKRKPWMSQDYRMDIFDAVALALVFWLRQRKKSVEVSISE